MLLIISRNELPNQPHLLNKYQINMEFSHFHEFGILSGMYILAPYEIYIVKACGFCNGNIILICYWVFSPTYHDFVRWKQHLFDILFFTRFCQGIDNCFYAFGNTRNTSKIRTLSHRKPANSNKVTNGNESLNWSRNFFLYLK